MSVVTKPGSGTEVVEPPVQEPPVKEPPVKDRDWIRTHGLNGGNRGLDDRGNGNGSGGGRGGGGDGPSGSPAHVPSGIGANVLGMLVFIASEAVLFLTLIVTFALARASYPEWPPPDQPRLPVSISLFNTVVLLGSGAAMLSSWRYMRRGWVRSSRRLLAAATLLGILFLAVQGFEWARLIDFGLTVTQNLYGAVFYVMIGMHALHVLVAVLGLLFVLRRFGNGAYTREHHEGLTMGGMFWGFVVLIWPVLFAFVYLL